MAYQPTEWINTLYDADGKVIQKGTPYSAENMNKIESELVVLSELTSTVATQENILSNHEQRIELAAAGVNAIEVSKGKPNGFAGLNADGIIPSSQLPSNLKEIRVVDTMAERDALERFEGLRVMVMDASPDPTVTSGWAEYVWDGLKFIKAAEMESLDMVLSWGNITEKPTSYPPAKHPHKEEDISDLDKYTKAEVNTMISGKSDKLHTHTEADIIDLDKYSQAQVNALLGEKSDVGHGHNEFNQITTLAEAIAELQKASGQLHSHENKDVLNKLIYSGVKPSIDLIELEELGKRKVSYNDLLDKPELPTKTSQLTNDSQYIKSNASRIHISYSPTDIPALQPNDIVLKVL